MKKTFRLEDLDCAHCAADIEDGLNRMENIKASVSFMTQKMTLEVAEGTMEEALERVRDVIKKIDADVTVTE